MQEIWKVIPDTDGKYEASNLGRIRSNMKKKPKILKQFHDRYMKVGVKYKGKYEKRYVHRLVALAFIPNPKNYPEINHINSNPIDNRIENLEWCDRTMNMRHCVKSGNHYTPALKGEGQGRSKLTNEKVRQIRKLYKMGKYNQPQLAKIYGVVPSIISSVICRRSWKHVK